MAAPASTRAGLIAGCSGAAQRASWRILARLAPPTSKAPSCLGSSRPGGPSAPSFVAGTVEGRPAVGSRVAVAVNGTVGGVSVTFREDGRHRFAVMVPPTAFRRGANVVDVHVIAGPVASPRLVALRTERASSYRLVDRDDGPAIVGPDGPLRVAKGRIDGYLDVLDSDFGAFRASGWALDQRNRGPVDTVLTFEGSRFLTSAPPSLPRADVARAEGVDRDRLGFRLSGSAEGVDLSRVRVFAISGTWASSSRTQP